MTDLERIAAKLAGVAHTVGCPCSRWRIAFCECDRPQRQAALVRAMIEAAGRRAFACSFEGGDYHGLHDAHALAAGLDVEEETR